MKHVLDRIEGYRLRLKARGLHPRYLTLTEAEAVRLVASLGLPKRQLTTTMSNIRAGKFSMRGMYVRLGPFTGVEGIKR